VFNLTAIDCQSRLTFVYCNDVLDIAPKLTIGAYVLLTNVRVSPQEKDDSKVDVTLYKTSKVVILYSTLCVQKRSITVIAVTV